MTSPDWIASLSRKLAQKKFHRVPVLLFRYYPRKQGPATIHDFDGDLTIELNRSSYISNAIYWGGHHSTHIADFLASYLRPEMTFADVGANIGEITLMAAKRLVKGRVLAFEPMPDTFAQLARNVELNRFKTVALFNHGLFNQDDSLSLYVKEDRPFGMVNEGVPSLFSTGVDQKALAVRLRKFDDVAVECDLKRLDVMKIDVEGAEMMVLRGGGEFHQKISSSNNCRNVRSKFPKSWLHVRGTTFLYSRIGL